MPFMVGQAPAPHRYSRSQVKSALIGGQGTLKTNQTQSTVIPVVLAILGAVCGMTSIKTSYMR